MQVASLTNRRARRGLTTLLAGSALATLTVLLAAMPAAAQNVICHDINGDPAGTDAGIDVLACGINTTASGINTTAIGGASVSGIRGIAVGIGASSTGIDLLAIGSGASATGINGIALGTASLSQSADATALGSGSHALFESSVALGSQAISSAKQGVAVGTRYFDLGGAADLFTQATALQSAAFGVGAVASAVRSTSFGVLSVASGSESLAGGLSSMAPSRLSNFAWPSRCRCFFARVDATYSRRACS